MKTESPGLPDAGRGSLKGGNRMDLKQKLAERLKQYKLLISFAAKQKTQKQER